MLIYTRHIYPENIFRDVYPKRKYCKEYEKDLIQLMKRVLTTKEYYIMQLRYKDGLTMAEIAEIDEITVCQVYQILACIKRKMSRYRI
jgi:DNA-directed RNA polymerase specialized sigma subunit